MKGGKARTREDNKDNQETSNFNILFESNLYSKYFYMSSEYNDAQ